ncbi:hypothetical protein SAMN04488065_2798 [Haloplanus vescus]|uniref:Uncharacterized protein n=1 Tax=Haloplanus vescus TaxID=555874 RepID=A0A1H4AI61_9EURY|nr:hypothetical protein [Haloplanus vescus]SEA35626.1 hypothetical protein SAMN04488065_2798 [Haloplanus vescus]
MGDTDGPIMSGDADGHPNGGTCPACKREYERALAFTDATGVLRGEISGDFCLTPEYLFVHSALTISAPDDDFPTRTIGAMGNRKEVPVDPTAVSDVWASDGDPPDSA